MATRDIIPAIQPNEQFPLGSYVNPYRQAAANAWLDKVAALSDKQFEATITRESKPPTPRTATSRRARMYNAALVLCQAWDNTMNPDDRKNYFKYAENGYRFTAAFVRTTNYLPACTTDLSLEILQMSQPDEQRLRAREFGHAAWQGMRMYAGVYNTFDRLLDHAKTRYDDLRTDDHREFFQAGMALPYMLSMTANLNEKIPYYTSFTAYDEHGQKMSLQHTDFKRFFTT